MMIKIGRYAIGAMAISFGTILCLCGDWKSLVYLTIGFMAFIIGEKNGRI